MWCLSPEPLSNLRTHILLFPTVCPLCPDRRHWTHYLSPSDADVHLSLVPVSRLPCFIPFVCGRVVWFPLYKGQRTPPCNDLHTQHYWAYVWVFCPRGGPASVLRSGPVWSHSLIISYVILCVMWPWVTKLESMKTHFAYNKERHLFSPKKWQKHLSKSPRPVKEVN